MIFLSICKGNSQTEYVSVQARWSEHYARWARIVVLALFPEIHRAR
jgi:uncharacterized protein YukE